eukprot:gnl/TRDRNA2_/TRDRNA2_60564_c0_seq1.p1 gnl/TRDRNA2_/TRDRNA2_60564_c0~~gnl/TRDRNA2_/TRDRNA2_60564_c0_seq1.p1  ORF type:complete len:265 (-),score=54.93 gnl/TRDRNA2_/TRDRNA2_60564_c0_seq1:123-878(-)
MGDATAGKLFLGGLAPTTTTEMITEHFAQFGKVVDAIAMYQNGKHRGFGFVTYESAETAALVSQTPQHIDGRVIEARLSLAKGVAPAPQGKAAQQAEAEKAKLEPKIFVGGLSPTTTTEMLQEHFQGYGDIVDVVAMMTPDGKARGFGFVTFATVQSAHAALNDVRPLAGRKLTLKSASKEGSAGQSSGDWGWGGGGKGGGDGFTPTQMAQLMGMMDMMMGGGGGGKGWQPSWISSPGSRGGGKGKWGAPY